MFFLTIPFAFSEANLRTTDYMLGMPSMTSVSGMADRSVQLINDALGLQSIKLDAFSIVYFGLGRDQYGPKRPAQMSRNEGADVITPSAVDIRRGNGEAALTLLLSVGCDDEFKVFSQHMEPEISSKVLQALVANLRFAGGTIDIGLKGEFGQDEMGLFITPAWATTLKRFMRAYPTAGLLIEDVSSMISDEIGDGDGEVLDAMLQLIYTSRVQRYAEVKPILGDEYPREQPFELEEMDFADGEEFEFDLDLALVVSDEPNHGLPQEEEYLGVIIPSAVGYFGITPVVEDCQTAESAASLVRAKILPSAALDLSEHRQTWHKHFWKWRYLEESRLYRCSALEEEDLNDLTECD